MFWRRRPATGLTDELAALVPGAVPGWAGLAGDERDQVLADADVLLRRLRWEAAQGFSLTDRMRVLVAAGGALLVLGLGVDALRRVRTVIVHPTTVWRSGPRPGPAAGVVVDGPMALVGEASSGDGPLLLAWDRAVFDARHPRLGRNVVLHELAHKLDVLDGTFDGMPPLGDDPTRRGWQQTMDDALEAVRQGELVGVLDDYAATNAAELFAVSTELFLTRPQRLLDGRPDVYGALRDFYRQDPAARRGEAPGPAQRG